MRTITAYTPLYAILEGKAGVRRLSLFILPLIVLGAYFFAFWHIYSRGSTLPGGNALFIAALVLVGTILWFLGRGAIPSAYRPGKSFKSLRRLPDIKRLSRRGVIAVSILIYSAIIVGGALIILTSGQGRFVGMGLLILSILFGVITLALNADAEVKIDTSLRDSILGCIFMSRADHLLAFRANFDFTIAGNLPEDGEVVGLFSDALVVKRFTGGAWGETLYPFDRLMGVSIGTGRDWSKNDYTCLLLLYGEGKRLHLNLYGRGHTHFTGPFLTALDKHLAAEDPVNLPPLTRVPLQDERTDYYSEV